MKQNSPPLFHIKLKDWVWWAWTFTTVLLTVGIFGIVRR